MHTPAHTQALSHSFVGCPCGAHSKHIWQFGHAPANQLAQRLAKWSEPYESEFSGSAHVRVCDCLCLHVYKETWIGEHCVKRFLQNKQKLRLTPNSHPVSSMYCKCCAGDRPYHPHLPIQTLAVWCFPKTNWAFLWYQLKIKLCVAVVFSLFIFSCI